MTEKLKYKVGDKVLVEAEVVKVEDDGDGYPYELKAADTFLIWFSEDGLDKAIVNLPPKPKVTQAMMDWYEKHKNERVSWDIRDWLHGLDEFEETNDWALAGEVTDLDRQHALATLIAYGPQAVEVEKEKKYRVRIKDNLVVGDTLTKNPTSLMFTFSISDGSDNEIFTKNELEDWGFGDAFDNPMFEVEEVE